jgi:FkbM family methyltransferase
MFDLSFLFIILIFLVLFLASISIILSFAFMLVFININFNFFYYNRKVKLSDITYIKNSLKFIVKMARLMSSSKYELKITTRDNTKYCGDLFNSTLCKCLYLNNNYEPSVTEYLKKTLKEGDIFIDVGANEGMFGILAGKLVGHTGKVYCIEPLPRNIPNLKKNIRINDLNNVIIYDVAAGDENKEVSFFDIKINNMLGGANNIIITILSKIPGMVQLITVKQRRLDTLINEPLDKIKLIKIDTEGYEEYVLKGLDTWLTEKCSIDFIIEMTPSKSKYIIDLLLDKHKYTGYMHWMDSVAFTANDNWERLDINCNTQKNVLFTKNRWEKGILI